MADIGIIGSYGISALLDGVKETKVTTKYGDPSGNISIGTIGGVEVALVPRHGKGHTIPPHIVPYAANLQALKDSGVTRIISTTAVGSLKPEYKPGDFILFDQFINLTSGRKDTIFDGGKVIHVSTAEPYCPEMRSVVSKASIDMDINLHTGGTVAVINGPRFSTKAESRLYAANGMDVINMTQYPEAALAREMGLCFLGIGTITDYDAGLEGSEGIESVSFGEVQRMFAESAGKLKSLVLDVIPKMPKERACGCANSLEGATVSE